MSAKAAAIARSWAVGSRTCTMTVPRLEGGQRRTVCVSMEWVPDVPRQLSAEEWRQYRTGRDAAAAELSAELGLVAMVVEL